jgi:hypothetical protein
MRGTGQENNSVNEGLIQCCEPPLNYASRDPGISRLFCRGIHFILNSGFKNGNREKSQKIQFLFPF